MQIYILPKAAQGHLKKSAFRDAGKIRSDSTNKFNTLGKVTFLPLIIFPATRYPQPTPCGVRGRNPLPKALKYLFSSWVIKGSFAQKGHEEGVPYR